MKKNYKKLKINNKLVSDQVEMAKNLTFFWLKALLVS